MNSEAIHEVLMKVWHREISADEGLDEIEDCLGNSVAGDYYEGLEEGFRIGQAMSSEPKDLTAEDFSVEFETHDKDTGITGSMLIPVKRTELQDDLTITVVVDYWPR